MLVNFERIKIYEIFLQWLCFKSFKIWRNIWFEEKSGFAGLNDEVDAFRHTFMQALLSLKIGETAARRLGTAWEIQGSLSRDQDSNERNMDQWNNAVGREIAREVKTTIEGKNYTPQEIEDIVAEKVMQRMRKGDLITNPNTDHRKFNERSFMDRILHPKNRVFHKGENITMNDLENNPDMMDAYLDQALERRGLPSREELDNKVASGEMVYVEGYEREDGTKVSGYYRSYPNC